MYPWGPIIVVILAVVTVVVTKKNLPADMSWQSVPVIVKALIWISILANPVIGGIILYYSLRKQFPQVAKKSNSISFIAFGVWVLIYVTYILFGSNT